MVGIGKMANKFKLSNSGDARPEKVEAANFTVNGSSGKPTRAPAKKWTPQQEKLLEGVKDQVMLAAAELRSIGPKMERVAWLLEDVLMYIEDPEDFGRRSEFSIELEAVTQASLIASMEE